MKKLTLILTLEKSFETENICGGITYHENKYYLDKRLVNIKRNGCWY